MILNDGEGLRALETDNLLSFDAGDQDRLYLFPRPSSLMTLQDSPTSFRIDGKCTQFNVAEAATV